MGRGYPGQQGHNNHTLPLPSPLVQTIDSTRHITHITTFTIITIPRHHLYRHLPPLTSSLYYIVCTRSSVPGRNRCDHCNHVVIIVYENHRVIYFRCMYVYTGWSVRKSELWRNYSNVESECENIQEIPPPKFIFHKRFYYLTIFRQRFVEIKTKFKHTDIMTYRTILGLI